MKLAGNRLHTENKEEKIERIHRPAQESGNECVPLRRGKFSESLDDRHSREHIRMPP
jgi:hypothetical protein